MHPLEVLGLSVGLPEQDTTRAQGRSREPRARALETKAYINRAAPDAPVEKQRALRIQRLSRNLNYHPEAERERISRVNLGPRVGSAPRPSF